MIEIDKPHQNEIQKKLMFVCRYLFSSRRAKDMVFQETHKSIYGTPETIPGFKGS